MAVTKKALFALTGEMLRDGQGSAINSEYCPDGDPDAMRADTQIVVDVVLEILRRTPLGEINKIVGPRRFHYDHT